MAPESDHMGGGVKRHLFDQSLDPTYIASFFGPPHSQLAILGPHENHSTPQSNAPVVVIHRSQSFYSPLGERRKEKQSPEHMTSHMTSPLSCAFVVS